MLAGENVRQKDDYRKWATERPSLRTQTVREVRTAHLTVHIVHNPASPGGVAEMARATAGAYFVYILRDPRIKDRRKSILYVGKGTGTRPADHVAEARRDLLQALDVVEGTEERADINFKLDRLRKILQAEKLPIVELILHRNGEPMDNDSAFLVEAGIIAALGMTEFGNKVKGHDLALVPENVFNRALSVVRKEIDPEYGGFVIPLTPNEGDKVRFAGHLSAAPDDYIWGRTTGDWTPVGAKPLRRLENMMDGDHPPIILSVSSHPFGVTQGIIIAVNQLTRAYESARKIQNFRKDGTAKKPYFAWRLERASLQDEHRSTTALRNELLGHALVDNGDELRPSQSFTYFGTMVPAYRRIKT